MKRNVSIKIIMNFYVFVKNASFTKMKNRDKHGFIDFDEKPGKRGFPTSQNRDLTKTSKNSDFGAEVLFAFFEKTTFLPLSKPKGKTARKPKSQEMSPALGIY